MLIAPIGVQDEHKRLEDTEKRSRETLGNTLEEILANMDHSVEEKENPECQKLNIEMDEWYVTWGISPLHSLTIAGFDRNLSPFLNNTKHATTISTHL